jgi:hypothetical protein
MVTRPTPGVVAGIDCSVCRSWVVRWTAGLTMMLHTRNASNSDAERVRQLVFSTLAEHGFEPDRSTTDADLERYRQAGSWAQQACIR